MNMFQIVHQYKQNVILNLRWQIYLAHTYSGNSKTHQVIFISGTFKYWVGF